MKKPLAYFSLVAVTAMLLAATAVFAQPTAALQNGRWLTESGNFEVDIAPCNNALCGVVTKVLANKSMSAPGTEMPATDTSSLMGMVILSDFQPAGDAQWKGKVFNRENGKLYSAVMSMPASDQLVIRSYVGLPLFGKTQVWRRVGVVETAK